MSIAENKIKRKNLRVDKAINKFTLNMMSIMWSQ